ncbi:MAG TPA: RES family NAD+ phosphorylase [Clostridia bacterium]|nr:RES family NAD+ phosphorylase [Clostridia bacterium]
MSRKKFSILRPQEQADLSAVELYKTFELYINQGGRFFFGNAHISPFFNELDALLPNLEKRIEAGEKYYRARLVEELAWKYSTGDANYEVYSESELGAPPADKTKEGRVNPQGVPYLYLADTRKCALAEVRPYISSMTVIGTGPLTKDIIVASFVSPPWTELSLLQIGLVKVVGQLFSLPLNNQNSICYLPTQVIAEYLKNMGFDGIEYSSSQFKSGANLALFDVNIWKATSSTAFIVSNIEYSAEREFNVFRYLFHPNEEL